MKKTDLLCSMIVLTLVPILLLGCAITNEGNEIVTSIVVSPSVQEEGELLATATVQATNTLEPTATNQIVLTPTPSPTATLLPKKATYICEELPQEISIKDYEDLRALSKIRLLGDDVLSYVGWGSRPSIEDSGGITPTPMTGQPEPNRSARTILKSGKIDFVAKESIPNSPMPGPLFNPCNERCPLEVLSQSPDAQWQIIQISDWYDEQVGIWLVNKTRGMQLLSHVPFKSSWEWAADSGFLWYTYPLYEVGSDGIIIELDNLEENEFITVDNESRIDPSYYITAFSPTDKKFQSTPGVYIVGEESDEVFFIDVAQGVPEVTQSTTIPGIESVFWDEERQAFLYIIANEEGLFVQDSTGDNIVYIPHTVFEMMFPTIENLTPSRVLPLDNYSLSPSGRTFAYADQKGKTIYVFNCE